MQARMLRQVGDGFGEVGARRRIVISEKVSFWDKFDSGQWLWMSALVTVATVRLGWPSVVAAGQAVWSCAARFN